MMMSPASRYGQDVVDHLVDGVAGLDHEHDAAGRLSRLASSSMECAPTTCGALGFVGDEVVDLGDGAVEDGDLESVVVHVEDEVLSHDGKADQADITSWFRHSLSKGLILALRMVGLFSIIQLWSDQWKGVGALRERGVLCFGNGLFLVQNGPKMG